jgi:hypothetical protein
LNSKYPEVAAAAARAMHADDARRRSVGFDPARRISTFMGVRTVEQITNASTPHSAWPTDLPPSPALPTTNAPLQPASDDATVWLWRMTWWPAGLLIAALAIFYGFAILTVPEPRLAIAKADR